MPTLTADELAELMPASWFTGLPCPPSVQPDLLAGLVQCRLCGRRLDSHRVHGRAGYRCRHGHSSTRPRQMDQPRNIYVREDVLLAQLAAQLCEPDEQNFEGRDGGDGRSKAPGAVSHRRAEALVIVHDGTNWELAPVT